MHIFHIATEIAPFAKVGGLADVVQGLAAEQANLGHDVEVIIPKYSWITKKLLPDLKITIPSFYSFDGHRKKNALYTAKVGKVTLRFIKPLSNKYFDREAVYGYPNDIKRFAYFSRAALDYLFRRKAQIDIIHIHDWHTALIAPLYHEIFAKQDLTTKGILLTIHNLSYQGTCRPKDLLPYGMKIDSPFIKQMKNSLFSSSVNILKGGINFSDAIVPVSPTYAKEIFFRKDACGLKKTLKKNKAKVKGIINGMDTSYWNPQTDKNLSMNYSMADPITEILKAKGQNKQLLRNKCHLAQKNKPLVSSITRLVPQKGPELIEESIIRTLEKGGQFILLGSSPDPVIDSAFRKLANSYKDNPNVAFIFEYDEPLSHLIYAASDFIVVPSKFEPCGLTQIISLIYGTIPIARKVGGLADTVWDCDDEKIPLGKRNGYTFAAYSPKGLFSALDRALNDWSNDKKKIRKLIQNGITEDFSWKRSAESYLATYRELLSL